MASPPIRLGRPSAPEMSNVPPYSPIAKERRLLYLSRRHALGALAQARQLLPARSPGLAVCRDVLALAGACGGGARRRPVDGCQLLAVARPHPAGVRGAESPAH